MGKQLVAFDVTPEVFAREIAPARTFAFEHDLAAIRAQGLAQGGTVENALLVTPEGYSSPLRFPDEIVRHKALDLLGDLALMGVRVTAEIIAVRCGHRWHHALAREMLRRLPRASVSIVPGCRHLPHLEAPERWVEWVLEALAEERP